MATTPKLRAGSMSVADRVRPRSSDNALTAQALLEERGYGILLHDHDLGQVQLGGLGKGPAVGSLLHAAGIAGAMGVAAVTGRYDRMVARVAGGLFALGGVGVLAGWL